jgi:hypothetical protein
MAEGLLDAFSSSAFLMTKLLRRILPDDFIPTRLVERLFGCVRYLPDYNDNTRDQQACWLAFTKAMPRWRSADLRLWLECKPISLYHAVQRV